jgi:NAD-dependent SIR2 family protein deacetylase
MMNNQDPAKVAAAISGAARAIFEADALLITTGAGMGVDMGLADFRSSNAFWEGLKHPEIRRYEDFSSSEWFQKDPALAWGINYSQIKAYRDAKVHAGYEALLKMVQLVQQKQKSKGAAYFCWTSNIDGVLQRAGFDAGRVRECHGNIHRLQCSQRVAHTTGLDKLFTGGAKSTGAVNQEATPCMQKAQEPWAPGTGSHPLVELELEESEGAAHGNQGAEGRGHRAVGKLPSCIHCGALARPNVMFCTDVNYHATKQSTTINSKYNAWVDACRGKKVVVIECGAGLAIPSVRVESEDIAESLGAVLVRVNPTDFMVPPPQEGISEGAARSARAIGVPLGSADGLGKILKEVEEMAQASGISVKGSSVQHCSIQSGSVNQTKRLGQGQRGSRPEKLRSRQSQPFKARKRPGSQPKVVESQPKVVESQLGPAQKQLLDRMEKKLPHALEQMQSSGTKIGHWAWWAFPTEMVGRSEPGASTNVTRATAAEVLSRAPQVWKDVLECVCELAEKKGKSILPPIDHGRVEHFIGFWAEVKENPPWMKAVIQRLKSVYGNRKR